MRYEKLLSVIPFYGGKGRMAHFIAEKLDYLNSDVFVTPFGGGCRVLLNKPRHPFEIYNDYSVGLCALMSILSNMDTAIELIRRVMDSEYSEEEFNRAKALFDLCETDKEEQLRDKITDVLLEKFPPGSGLSVKNLFKWDDTLTDKEKQKNIEIIDTTLKEIEETRKRARSKKDIAFWEKFDFLVQQWKMAWDAKISGQLPRSKDLYQIDDMDLAYATYVVYMMSRDGMGKVFTNAKFRGTEHYHKRAQSLFACAERLEGIQVQQLDAFTFFRKQGDYTDGFFPSDYQIISEWLDNPDVMMYLDPSYIKVESERKALEGIDWYHADSLSKAIIEKRNKEIEQVGIHKARKLPQNLGEVYSRFFNYEQQEKFLRLICQARCKILISNYDLILYHKYLTMNGWSRAEYLTSTSVGSKAGNSRTEVIWWNY